MYQNEIQFFWPLTEQINLDLDYTPCKKFQDQKMMQSAISCGTTLSLVNSGTAAYTTSITPNALTVDIDALPITVRSKDKPNLFARWVYKAMGVKWEHKC